MADQDNRTSKKIKIALIGCGKMGGALLQGWLSADLTEKIYVLDPAGPPEKFKSCRPDTIEWHESTDSFLGSAIDAEIFVMAVKPQIMKDVCEQIKEKVLPQTLVLSIAAGQTIALFEKYFGSAQPVIRVMPNTPAAIGKGVSVAVANMNVNGDQKNNATRLMETVGIVKWLEQESLMDAVTAVSGSGPAYVFYLIEAMAEAGKQCGLDKDMAMALARQTVIGSAALAEKEESTPASRLRENVTSPGGTTAAALDILMRDDRFTNLITEAITAATEKGKELASS